MANNNDGNAKKASESMLDRMKNGDKDTPTGGGSNAQPTKPTRSGGGSSNGDNVASGPTINSNNGNNNAPHKPTNNSNNNSPKSGPSKPIDNKNNSRNNNNNSSPNSMGPNGNANKGLSHNDTNKNGNDKDKNNNNDDDKNNKLIDEDKAREAGKDAGGKTGAAAGGAVGGAAGAYLGKKAGEKLGGDAAAKAAEKANDKANDLANGPSAQNKPKADGLDDKMGGQINDIDNSSSSSSDKESNSEQSNGSQEGGNEDSSADLTSRDDDASKGIFNKVKNAKSMFSKSSSKSAVQKVTEEITPIKKIKQIAKWTTIIVGGAIGLMLLSSSIAGVIPAVVDECSDVSDNVDGDNLTSEDAEGSGLGGARDNIAKKGTKENKVAKKVFTYWTKKRGFAGTGAAGVVGNAWNESHLDPTIIQGGGHTDNPKSVTGDIGTHGYGLYQISPGSYYGNWSGFTKSTVENQSEYMWSGYGGAAISRFGSLSKAPSKVKHEIAGPEDPEHGAFNWYYWIEMGMHTFASYDQKANREAAAKLAYKAFNGAKIKVNDSLLGAEDGASGGGGGIMDSEGESAKCNSDTQNDSSLLGIIKDIEENSDITYSQNHNPDSALPGYKDFLNGGSGKDLVGKTDCSGYVWLVLAKAGYKVPEKMQWFTGSMEADAKGDHKYLKEIDKSDAKAGDIFIINTGGGSGSNGHTGILVEDWQEGSDKSNGTLISNEGGSNAKPGPHTEPFNEAVLSLLQGRYSLTFARPAHNK